MRLKLEARLPKDLPPEEREARIRLDLDFLLQIQELIPHENRAHIKVKGADGKVSIYSGFQQIENEYLNGFVGLYYYGPDP